MTKYFDVFLSDLLISCGSNKWRERQSAALAIGDLISGRSWSNLKPYIEELWVMLLRVADDIKDSVRDAAAIAVNILSKASVRLCDPSISPATEAKEAVEVILSYLLHKGIVLDAKECQAVSLDALLKITKVCGNVLKPMVPDMAVVLLKSLSGLENAALNYMMFHTARLDMTQEQLEKARIQAASSSPMQEALYICMKQAGEAEVAILLPRVIELVTHGVGLNTRCGAIRLLVDLIDKYPAIVAPWSSKLMNNFIRCHTDRSHTVKKEVAIGAAHLSKICKNTNVLKDLITYYCTYVYIYIGGAYQLLMYIYMYAF